MIVGHSGDPVLVTNAVLHGEPMHSNIQTSWFRDVRPLPHPSSTGTRLTLVEFALEAVDELAPGGAIGISDVNIPAPPYLDLQQRLGRRLIPAQGVLTTLRRIKSAAEIAKIREVAAIATSGMEAAIAVAKPGVTEHEIAAAAYQASFAAGADRMNSFFAVAGERSFMKNVLPLAGKRVRPGEIVELDMNLLVSGYQADHARNTVAGDPSPQVRDILELSAGGPPCGRARRPSRARPSTRS